MRELFGICLTNIFEPLPQWLPADSQGDFHAAIEGILNQFQQYKRSLNRQGLLKFLLLTWNSHLCFQDYFFLFYLRLS